MTPYNRAQNQSEVDATAAEWIARCDAGLSAEERREFEQWRAADLRHIQALARFSGAWLALGRPRRTGGSAALSEELGELTRRRRRRRSALAGGCMATFLIAAMTWWTNRVPPDARTAPAAQAVLLGPQSQTLPDGSVIEFPVGAQFTVDFSDTVRRVGLKHGEAHFQVMKDRSRPFVVDAGGIEVRAVGTGFAVQLGSAAVEVMVTSGRVAVDRTASSLPQPHVDAPADIAAPRTSAMLNAGDRVVVDVTATSGSLSTLPVLAVSAREIAERLSWRSPRVEFSNTPLAEVVAFLNRRNQVQFVIEDGALGATALSGLFRADDTDSFVRVMETAFGVKAERSGTQIFLRKVR